MSLTTVCPEVQDSHSWFTPSSPELHFEMFSTFLKLSLSSVQFSPSVVSHSLHPTNRSTPGFPVHHELPESAQTHVHRVSDAIQPSHPLSSPFPPAFSLSQHQGLFQGVSSSYQVVKYWSFSHTFMSREKQFDQLLAFKSPRKYAFFEGKIIYTQICL